MKSLVAEADVITPNFTEACLLVDRPYRAEAPETDALKEICQQLATKNNQKVVITSVPGNDANQIKVACFDSNSQNLCAILYRENSICYLRHRRFI